MALLKKGVIALLVCLFVFSAFGKSGDTPPSRSFLQMFKRLFKSPKEKEEQCAKGAGKCLFIHNPEETNTSSDKDTLQQCAVDLCGPPNPETSLVSYSYDAGIERLAQSDLMKEWEDEFHALGINEILEKWIDREMEPSVRLQKVFQKSGLSRKPGFDYLESEDYENLSHTFFDDYIQLDVDRSKPLSDRLSIVIDWPKESSRQLEEGLKSYAQAVKREMNSSLKEQIYQGVYTSKEAYAVLKEKWKAFTEKHEKEKKINSDFDRLEDMAEGMKEMREIMDTLTKEMEGFSEEEKKQCFR